MSTSSPALPPERALPDDRVNGVDALLLEDAAAVLEILDRAETGEDYPGQAEAYAARAVETFRRLLPEGQREMVLVSVLSGTVYDALPDVDREDNEAWIAAHRARMAGGEQDGEVRTAGADFGQGLAEVRQDLADIAPAVAGDQ